MARKKQKHPNLPNGFGSIKKLSGNRTNPYAVHPPTTEFNADGIPKTPKALCYVDDWYVGFAVLTAYKAGTYTPGMENDFKKMQKESALNSLAERILADYGTFRNSQKPAQGPTFADVYAKFYDWKFNGKKQYSNSSRNSTTAAYKNCAALHDKIYSEITYLDMQEVLDNCGLKHSSLELISSLFKQMAKYARAEKIVPDLSAIELLKINIEDDDEHGVPFSEEELKTLWENKGDRTVEALLIMCYSGHRIGELPVIDVDLKNRCFIGGIKTGAGKGRTVPMHSAILPLVRLRMKRDGSLMNVSSDAFRTDMYATLGRLGIEKHTPHDCRHTFSALCERYGVRENDRKRMLGHAFQDVTNQVYGHRSLGELRTEIEKIKVCR